MKKIILFLLVSISISSFSCKTLINPKNSYIVKEKKLYYKGTEMKGVDIKSFKNITYSYESCQYRDYIKDNKNVYFKNLKVEGADPQSFVMIEQGYYKDKRYIYFYGKKLVDSNSQKDIKIIKDNKDTNCIPWGDGGCIINNGYKYLNGEKIK